MLQKTELLKITVDDLDGEPAEPAAPVNILREKTFNPELSSLLNKIYSHEKTTEIKPPATEEIDPGLKIMLLQKCDQLLYKLKHQDEAGSLTSEFNPFSLDINVYDEIDDLNDYIETGMRQIGFSRFLIMKYNFKDAAFRTDLNRIDDTLTSDLFFGTKDPAFIYMYENNKGMILNEDVVNSNLFMKKKLARIFQQGDSHNVIYFVRLCSLCYDDDTNLMTKNSMSLFEQYLSPILAVIPDTDKEYHDDNEFFAILKSNMNIPFSIYAMKNNISFDSSGFSYEEALLMLELVMSSPVIKGMKCSLLSLDNFSVKENLFILKFLLARIKKRLEKNSFFMRVGIDKCILITSENEENDIADMIDEINVGEKIISMKSVDTITGSDNDSFTSLFL